MIDPDTPGAVGDAAAVLPAVAPGEGAARLDRRRILGTAVELIDTDGLRALTMRRLGQHLGVQAMALYHYIPSRAALLDGVVEVVIDELYGDPQVHLTSDDWPRYLRQLAHGVRRIALAHPQVFPLVATRPPAAPWIRPPLRSLRWVEAFLSTLRDCGFSDRAAAKAYQSFSSFLLGHLLLEISGTGADIGPVDEPDPRPARARDLQHYPLLQELAPELAENHAADEFASALEGLLNRLATAGVN